jgi:NDP-sugar pyrophosphorylase family protein
VQAVILAGGKGARLRPFTNVIPKPLVPVGDLPILEIVLRQLKAAGTDRVVIAVNYLARLIETFFGDGSRLGLKIVYSIEDEPLGTAGPLRLVRDLDDDFLVLNGDVLTTIDFGDLFRGHQASGAVASIATFKKSVKIDLGVIKVEQQSFADYIEKPTYDFVVSTGMYAMSHEVLRYIPKDRKFDMPDLMLALHAGGQKIHCYSGSYDWLDMGRVDDYEKAIELFEVNRSVYLGAERA